MTRRGSFQLARIFGIRVGVGVSWFLVLFLYIFTFTPYFHDVLGGSQTRAYIVTVASVLSFFLSLVLHELGHALVARRNGQEVIDIQLWALGGITRTRGVVDRPGPEFRVAVAGPLVTVGVVAVSVAVGALLADRHHFFDVAVGNASVRTTPAVLWLSWLATINVLVLALNLVPAFPLDGGQIAHAVVWWRTGDRNRATRITGRLGQGFALLIGGLALLLVSSGYGGAIWFLFIALFIYQGAGAAVAQSRFSDRIQGVTVADIMDREPVTIPASTSMLDAQEQYFLRYRWPWFAVVDETGRFLSVVRVGRVEAEIASGRPALAVGEVLEADAPGLRIKEDQPLEALLGAEGMRRLGAMMAVDGDGVLRGVVTLTQVRRALNPLVGSP